jgi:putative transposase
VVDTQGFVLKAFVTEADYQDRVVAQWLLKGLKADYPRLTKIWADGAYTGLFVEKAAEIDIEVEVVKRNDDSRGFVVVPRRWVVERSFAWLSNYRRLSKDYEYWVTSSDAMIYAASIHLMLCRLARLRSPT